MKRINFNVQKAIPILIVVVLLGVSLRIFYRNYKISLCNTIYIAKPIDISGGLKTGFTIHYTFKKNSNSINGSDDLDKKGLSNNGENYYMKKRFFVKVACSDDSNSEIVWDVPVPDSLTYVPDNGWNEIPVKRPQER
jgi:hypothetical protein